MMRVMHEVTSGPKLAILMLVVVPTHLLPQNRLVENELFHSVGEETVFSVAAVTGFGITSTELKFAFSGNIGCCFVGGQFQTHDQENL